MAIAVLLGGCSTTIERNSQSILVNTNPPGADCGLYRQGIRIATVQNAPGRALIAITKDDIWIACVKPGYQQATYVNHLGAAGVTVGSIILADTTMYDSPVNITMVPNVSGQPEGPTTLPASFAASPAQPAPVQQPPR
jgi:hypothetical protein